MNELKRDLVTDTVTTPDGVTVHIANVPAHLDEDVPGGWSYSMAVSRRLEQLLKDALRAGPVPGTVVTLEYSEGPAAAPGTPDPVSLAIARAIEASGLSKAEVARRMGVKPPIVSRLVNPRYHGHSATSLYRLADALGMRLEVGFVPAEPGEPEDRSRAA